VKESLYVPLTDTQKYKAKAFIDMFVDRAAKAGAAFALIGLIQVWGAAARPSLVVGLASTVVWMGAAQRLGTYFRKHREAPAKGGPMPTAIRPEGASGGVRTEVECAAGSAA
jgi:AAA family ATP:ADP antiporter